MTDAELSSTSVLLTILKENQRLREANQSLTEENKKLGARILDLEEKLNTNSNNSSKAPSQDPFRSFRQSQLSGKKPGGQPGHPGHTRAMVSLDNINKVIEVKPECCCRCGAKMSRAV